MVKRKYERRSEKNVSNAGTCRGPECTTKAMSRGLCVGHYTQEYRGKELTPLKTKESA